MVLRRRESKGGKEVRFEIDASLKLGDPGKASQSIDLLSSLLRVHNAIEENSVYPEFAETPEEVLRDLEVPEGWVPKFASGLGQVSP